MFTLFFILCLADAPETCRVGVREGFATERECGALRDRMVAAPATHPRIFRQFVCARSERA